MGKEKAEKMKFQKTTPPLSHNAAARTAPPSFERPMKIIGVCAMIFIVASLVYANTLRNDFIWDDEYLILNNSQVKSFKHLPNVFKTYVGYGSENINNFYRPVQEISNMVDYFLWGIKPFGFHLTNVVLHALVSVMVCVFLYYIAGDRLAAGIGALFWAVHPIHTEAVAYIAGRADLLYSFFMLLSLVLFISFIGRVRENRRSHAIYAASLAAFVVSLLSKEIIITMPLLVFLYIFYFVRPEGDTSTYRKVRWSWLPYAAIVAFYGYLRLTVLNFSHIAPPSVFGKIPLANRVLTFFRSVRTYFELLAYPHDLHMERTIAITKNIFDLQAIGALLLILAICCLAYIVYKKGNRVVSFGIAWFFANLLPVSNLVPINSFLAEHWIYMASVGVFLIVGVTASALYRKDLPGGILYRWALTLVLAVLIGAYAGGTVLRNNDWKDEITFFRSTLKYHPRNARLYLNLGNTYYEKGEIDNAVEQYRKAIAINPGYAVAYGNIGSAYLNKGDYAKAEEYLIKAIDLQQKYPIAHYNLGIIYQHKSKYNESIKELQIATEQLPQFYQAWNMLGATYLRLGKTAEARAAFERSLAIMPKQDKVEKMLQKIP